MEGWLGVFAAWFISVHQCPEGVKKSDSGSNNPIRVNHRWALIFTDVGVVSTELRQFGRKGTQRAQRTNPVFLCDLYVLSWLKRSMFGVNAGVTGDVFFLILLLAKWIQSLAVWSLIG
jgi:hypothetical protein